MTKSGKKVKNRLPGIATQANTILRQRDFSLFTFYLYFLNIFFFPPPTYHHTAIGRCYALSVEVEEEIVFAGVIFPDICLDIADARSDGVTAFQFHTVIEETAVLAVSGHGERDGISALFQF